VTWLTGAPILAQAPRFPIQSSQALVQAYQELMAAMMAGASQGHPARSRGVGLSGARERAPYHAEPAGDGAGTKEAVRPAPARWPAGWTVATIEPPGATGPGRSKEA